MDQSHYLSHVRTTIVLVLLLLAARCFAQAESVNELRLPSFGVCVTEPTGLSRISEGGMSHVARWAKLDRSGATIGVITLEVEPANGRTVEQWAQNAAAKFGAAVTTETKQLGDEECLHLVTTTKSLLLHPDEAYACQRGGYVWVVASFASPRWSDRAAVEKLRKSVRFMPPSPPAECLDFYPTPKVIFTDVRMNVPTIMRPLDPPAPGQIQMGIWNYESNRDEFSIVLDVIPGKIDTSSDHIVDNWAKMIATKLGLQTAPKWRRLQDSQGKIILDPISVEKMPGSNERTPMKMIYALAELAPERTMILTASVNDQASTAAYQACFDKVVAAVAVAPPLTPARLNAIGRN